MVNQGTYQRGGLDIDIISYCVGGGC